MNGTSLGVRRGNRFSVGPLPSLSEQLRLGVVHLWEMDSLKQDGQGNYYTPDLVGSVPLYSAGGALPTVVSGKLLNAFSLNGSTQWLNAVNDSTLHTAQGFTFIAWYKTSYTGATQILLSKGAFTDTANFEYTLLISSTQVIFGLGITLLAGTTSFSTTADIVTTDNAWHFVAGRMDLTTGILTLFIDGVSSTSATTLASLALGYTYTSSTKPFMVGTQADSLNLLFNGSVDDIGMFTSALSDTQLLYLWNNGVGRRYPWDATGAAMQLLSPSAIEAYVMNDSEGRITLN